MDDLTSRQAAISVEGLDEQIRCEMCRNPMHTNRGCDGNCKYDEKLYERIMQILGERIKPLPPAQPKPCEDCVSRKAVIRLLHSGYHSESMIDEVKELPPAKPEPVRINLNELIKVKLTDWGKEIYYHQYDRTNQIAGREICKPKFPKEDENGYTEFQLWCFIELYGEHMGMTLPNVIEPLEIIYKR